MDDGRLTQLLWHNSADLTAATPFCPEDALIAAYFEGALGEPGRDRLRNHIAECRFCQARLGNLARSTSAREHPHVAAQVLADAKQLGKPANPKKPNWQAPAWAAAATVVLAVILVFSGQWQHPSDITTTQPVVPASEQGNRQLRSLGRMPSSIRIIEPAPGAILMPGASVRWAGGPDVDHYDLFILSANGDLVWSERLSTTSWSPQAALGLTAGDRYYLRVEATLRDGTTVSSRHTDFRIAER